MTRTELLGQETARTLARYFKRLDPRLETFTREEILDCLRIEPCHVTGTHEPEHHLKYRCNFQRSAAFGRVVKLLGLDEGALPRALHGPECNWCHSVPTRERYRERLRATYRWAGVKITRALAQKGKADDEW